MRKSLKEEPNIKQIRNDVLLGITVQPENTCPLIDPLKSAERSKDFRNFKAEVKLGESPDSYLVNMSNLFERGNQLREWSEQMIELFESHIKINQEDIDSYNEKVDHIADIKRRINDNDGIEYDLNKAAKTINDAVKDWGSLNDDFYDVEKRNSEFTKEKETAEEELSELDEYNDEDAIYELETQIDYLEDQIKDAEKEINSIERDFSRVERFIEDGDIELDKNLELYRTNNDNIRGLTANIRRYLLDNHDGQLNITQPMKYLKQIEIGKDTEISLGVLDNSGSNFKKITDYLEKSGVISGLQKNVLDKLLSNTSLLDTLKKEGYTDIQYYKKEEDFLNDKNSFIREIVYDNADKKLIKIKM